MCLCKLYAQLIRAWRRARIYGQCPDPYIQASTYIMTYALSSGISLGDIFYTTQNCRRCRSMMSIPDFAYIYNNNTYKIQINQTGNNFCILIKFMIIRNKLSLQSTTEFKIIVFEEKTQRGIGMCSLDGCENFAYIPFSWCFLLLQIHASNKFLAQFSPNSSVHHVNFHPLNAHHD